MLEGEEKERLLNRVDTAAAVVADVAGSPAAAVEP
jgi:hypothetical protein